MGKKKTLIELNYDDDDVICCCCCCSIETGQQQQQQQQHWHFWLIMISVLGCCCCFESIFLLVLQIIYNQFVVFFCILTNTIEVTIGNQARHNNNQRSDFVLVEAIGLLVKQNKSIIIIIDWSRKIVIWFGTRYEVITE